MASIKSFMSFNIASASLFLKQSRGVTLCNLIQGGTPDPNIFNHAFGNHFKMYMSCVLCLFSWLFFSRACICLLIWPIFNSLVVYISLYFGKMQVKSLLNDAKSGIPTNNATGTSLISNIVGGSNSSASNFHVGSSAPPLSPRIDSGSPHSLKQRTNPFSLGSTLKCEPVRENIPQVWPIEPIVMKADKRTKLFEFELVF